MEQATNSFNKGIQMDTHPMVQGNDSLTDCLNGTLITMDGNEVILQNDMGNRKVDNAYLPAGYQPVGIKEHGGIIYVASYNPITNKSQIGSFPSPERKISFNDKSDLGEILNLESLSEVDSENFLIKDSILIPVSGDSILHPGDKFILYADLSDYETDITNYNNTNGKKVISPKNKKYTLQLGILNSQNQFVDITKNLLRWKNNEIVYYNSSVLDLYKFNDGYFIPNEVNITEQNQTIDDKILLEERLALPTNTYLNKLNGPLYLKASINHISNFSYSISANILDDKLKIILNTTIEYNCPDTDSIVDNPTTDVNYESYYETIPTYNFFDFFTDELIELINDNTVTLNLLSSEKSKSIYDPNTNLYKCNIQNIYILKQNGNDYIIPSSKQTELEENGIKYEIRAKVPSTSENKYLKKFSYSGEISVLAYVNGIAKWKFKYNTNNDNVLEISYAIGDEKGIGNLEFQFTNVINPNDVVTSTPGITGTFIEGNISLSNLTANALYKVTWSYTRDDGESITDGDRWVIVNEMFNDCFNLVNDFGIKSDEILNKAKFSVSLNTSVSNTITTKNIEEKQDGSIFSLTAPTGTTTLKKQQNAVNNAVVTIQQTNNTLPSFLSLDLSEVGITVPYEIEIPGDNVKIELGESAISKINTNTIKIQSNLSIPSYLKVTDFESKQCNNVFVSMYDFIYDQINNKTQIYGGCYVISGEDTNDAVKSKFRVYKSTREQISRKINMDEAIADNYYKGAVVVERDNNIGTHNFTWNAKDESNNSKIRNKMFDDLAGITGLTIPSDQVFLWGYNDSNNNLNCKSYLTSDPDRADYINNSNKRYGEHDEYCRFFWKSNRTTSSSNTKWALIPIPVYKYPGDFALYFWDHYLPNKYKHTKFAYYKSTDVFIPKDYKYTTYVNKSINGQIYGVKLNNNYKSQFNSWIPDFTPIILTGYDVELCEVSSDQDIRDLIAQLENSVVLQKIDLVKDTFNLNLNTPNIYDYDDNILNNSIFSLDESTDFRLPLYNLPDNESSWLKNCPSYNDPRSRFDACWAKVTSSGKTRIVQAGFEYTNTYAVKI